MRPRLRKQKIISGFHKHPHADLIGYWCTRILLDLGGLQGLSGYGSNRYTHSGSILKAMNLGELEDEDISARDFKKLLRKKQRTFQKAMSVNEGNLPENISKLSKILKMNAAEQYVLLFAVIINSHPGLDETADALENLTSEAAIQAVANILDLDLRDVRSSLNKKSMLQRAGLLRLTTNGTESLTSKLEIADGLPDILSRRHSDVMSMLEQYFQPAPPAQFLSRHFPHVDIDIELLTTYLTSAMASRNKGINVLLYGLPGTGKTEFSKMIAKRVGARLYEVSTTDEDDEPIESDSRFRAYRLTQEALSLKNKTMVLFDEVEDVFPSPMFDFGGLFSFSQPTGNKKGWINKLLEENPVPAIWISNSIDQIDNAFIRRFDYVLEIPTPPRAVRLNILKKNLASTDVNRKWIEAIADNKHLAPAIVTRATKVATMVSNNSPEEIQQHMERTMGNTMKAMGYDKQIISDRNTTLRYQLDALNPDYDIKNLISGLKRHHAGRICLYGPPGTGKTAFGHYVAKTLDQPLLVKRASDLLGIYVGQTEKQLAAMFEEARNEEAILLLDEADSFLRDRNSAGQGWEVTQVNELLTQMEKFQGIFICSTNLIDTLDAASIRRFDFKIKLDYMTLPQVSLMFRQVLKDQGVAFRLTRLWQDKLARYKNLTPGDFATVIRQSRFSDQLLTPEVLLTQLAKEAEFKVDDNSVGIGFTANI